MSTPYRVAIIHSVPDYDRWFDVIHEARGRMPSVFSMTVHRSVDDENEVMVEIEVESVEVARSMLQEENLRDILDRAGLEFYPPVFIGERVDELSS